MEILKNLFSDGYMPHGHCFFWTPSILWSQVAADSIIAISYYSIPLALLYLIKRRSDLQYQWIFILFALFILACGTTHIISIWNMWHGDYGFEAIVKIATAVASLLTAIMLWPLIPKVLAIPGQDVLEKEVRERRKAEQQLRQANDDLEDRVKERTLELETLNQQLRLEILHREKAQDEMQSHSEMLARTNAELEQFAYIASHDLREPLRMITGFTQLLKKKHSDKFRGDAEELFGFIVQGAERMESLINDLLSFSRVNSHVPVKEQVATEEALQAALVNSKVAIEESKASITWDPLPQLRIAKGLLTQLFQNLIGNGIKFRTKEAPHIHISAAREGNYWKIGVADNGIGIEPKYHLKVFEVFKRLHSHEEYPGTGIGLAVCKKIVERYGGRVWVESELGKGATFYFLLPAIQEEGISS